jgi:SAM-dependent methyltransferase
LTQSHAPEAEVLWDLEQLKKARGLTNWMFAQFQPFVTGRVLEIGAGIGTFSELLLRQPVSDVVLMEPYPGCVEVLSRSFSGTSGVEVVAESLPDSPTLRQQGASFDFVLCQNVLEHIEDDGAALQAMADSLKPGGRLGLLVPAHPRLFGNLDRAYGHYRRYTKPVLGRLIEKTGMEIDDLYSFNALGIPGWWVQGRRRSAQLSSASLSAYELLLRAWRPLEEQIRLPWGLSLIAQLRKPA